MSDEELMDPLKLLEALIEDMAEAAIQKGPQPTASSIATAWKNTEKGRKFQIRVDMDPPYGTLPGEGKTDE